MYRRYAALSVVLSTTLPLLAEPVTVGKFSAKIVPERIAMLNLTERGTVTDLVDSSNRLKAGTVVAILNKKRTQTEHEDMELMLARERLNKKDEVQKLRAQRAKVQFYLSLNPQERRFNTDFKGDEIPTPSSLRDIDDRISLLERELATMERRKREEFAYKHDPLTLRMPFDGRLQYNVTLPDDLSQPLEYTETIRTFATVCDDSAYYITLEMGESDLSLLDEKRFSATVRLPGGRKLQGTYSHRRVERAGNGGDMLVYFFRIPEEMHATAYNMLGSNTNAVLIYETGTETLHVSKAELIAHPAAANSENWEELVSHTHPDHAILLIGQRKLVLVPKK